MGIYDDLQDTDQKEEIQDGGQDGLPARRRWVHGDVSRRMVVDTAIEVIRSEPFPSVTSRTIAERAGVSHSSIRRNFSSMEGLFVAVAEELNERFATRAQTRSPEHLIDDDVILRSRLVAWMLGEGMDPSKITYPEGRPTLTAVIERQQATNPVSERTAKLFGELSLFIGEGFATFAAVHPNLDSADVVDAIKLIEWMRSHLDQAERDLGWDGACSDVPSSTDSQTSA